MDAYLDNDPASLNLFSYDTNLNEILNADIPVLQNTVQNRNQKSRNQKKKKKKKKKSHSFQRDNTMADLTRRQRESNSSMRILIIVLIHITYFMIFDGHILDAVINSASATALNLIALNFL
ncbi:MAG: hypothetical protein EZS28_015429 [Streblomastix strix]|uniref:Uncharacterized protein n=1 Tax=Streblomastix strix TaxID=222440 RepID=A0A5J4W232_9EUKA|nr:MAG: hypothetical protein EZS28_015429 [Streblomastix strix]